MKLSSQYATLGSRFCEAVMPQKSPEPRLLMWNQPLADELDFDAGLAADEQADDRVLAGYFSGNTLLPGSQPVALAYAGHQFGNFVPQLGDGRAHLLGEITDRHGQVFDIQLKGSGQTRFSRNGDGRCALGPAIREFLMSEAMHALGVPTARSLAVTLTGEQVYRESIQPGAVVTRIAASHLRVGTFEYFAARKDHAAIEQLCDFAMQRHYPELADLQGQEKFTAFLNAVIDRQLELVVHWLRVGFIHGVMNTDNTTISGETIDFGPCAMLGSYDLQTVYSSIDRQGRYAFGNQPSILQWNMARLAETLIPLLAEDQQRGIEMATACVDRFGEQFTPAYQAMLSGKLGLGPSQPGDEQLIGELLTELEQQRLDYTVFFNRLTHALGNDKTAAQLQQQLPDWLPRWQQRVKSVNNDLQALQADMRQHNPVLIPRNHHVEQVIAACSESLSDAPAQDFLRAIRSPYRETPVTLQFQDVPADGDAAYRTFCGT